MKRLLLLFLLPSVLLAVEPAKRELITQLLDVADLRGTLENLRRQNVELVRRQVEEQNAKTEFAGNPIMRRLIARVMVKYDAYSHEFMGWAKWEPRYVALYDKAFTEAQLRETVQFLKSDAGKAWMTLQTQTLARMQGEMLQNAEVREAKIQQIMDETVAEIKAELEAEAAKEQAATKPAPAG